MPTRQLAARFLLAQVLGQCFVSCYLENPSLEDSSYEDYYKGVPHPEDYKADSDAEDSAEVQVVSAINQLSFNEASSSEEQTGPSSARKSTPNLRTGKWTKKFEIGIMTLGGIMWETSAHLPNVSNLLYVARTTYATSDGDQIIPCYYKLDPQDSVYPGRVILDGLPKAIEAEKLTYLVYDKAYQWYSRSYGEICEGAVIGGVTSRLSHTFICRIEFLDILNQTSTFTGILDPASRHCAAPYMNYATWAVMTKETYHILCDSMYIP